LSKDLDAVHDGSVRGLILNSPSNPTGAVYTLDELRDIATWANERGIWVISDEIYGRICYNAVRAPSMLQLEDSLLDRVVVVDGASKAFAMTGWRLGFSYSTPQLASAFANLQSHITSNVSTPAQHAAMAAFRIEPRVDHAVQAMVGVFRHRRERVLTLLEKYVPGAAVVPPDGEFYLFFRVDGFYGGDVKDSVGFCTALIERAGVALVPGVAFGDDRYVRLSFAAAEDELAEGIRRMGEAVSLVATG
jgi:aspartate aminotransferase